MSQVSWEMGASSTLHKDYKLIKALFWIPDFLGPSTSSPTPKKNTPKNKQKTPKNNNRSEKKNLS